MKKNTFSRRIEPLLTRDISFDKRAKIHNLIQMHFNSTVTHNLGNVQRAQNKFPKDV